MLNILVFSAVFVSCITICRFTFVTSGITSCVDSFDFIAAQSCVVVPMNKGEAPYFSESLFTEKVHRYLEKNLKRYLTPFDKWGIDFFFSGDAGNLSGTKTDPSKFYMAGFAINCRYLGFATFTQKKMFTIEVGKTYEG